MLFVTPQWGIKHIKHLNARAGNMPNTSIASLGDAVKHTNKGIYYIYIFFFVFKRIQELSERALYVAERHLVQSPPKTNMCATAAQRCWRDEVLHRVQIMSKWVHSKCMNPFFLLHIEFHIISWFHMLGPLSFLSHPSNYVACEAFSGWKKILWRSDHVCIGGSHGLPIRTNVQVTHNLRWTNTIIHIV